MGPGIPLPSTATLAAGWLGGPARSPRSAPPRSRSAGCRAASAPIVATAGLVRGGQTTVTTGVVPAPAADAGFGALATKNTQRIPLASGPGLAAAVAGAVYPEGGSRPERGGARRP